MTKYKFLCHCDYNESKTKRTCDWKLKVKGFKELDAKFKGKYYEQLLMTDKSDNACIGRDI